MLIYNLFKSVGTGVFLIKYEYEQKKKVPKVKYVTWDQFNIFLKYLQVNYATKIDLYQMEERIKSEIKKEISGVKKEIKQEIKDSLDNFKENEFKELKESIDDIKNFFKIP